MKCRNLRDACLLGIFFELVITDCTRAGEIASVPFVPGGAYVTVEGAYRWQDSPGVSAAGDLSNNSGANANGTAAGSAFSYNEFYSTVGATALPPDRQAVSLSAQGGSPSATSRQSSGTAPAIAETTQGAAANFSGFLNAFVTASANGAQARANAQGGSFIAADAGQSGEISLGYRFVSPLYGVFDRVEIYGSVSRSSDDRRITGAAGAISVDGKTGFAAAAVLPSAAAVPAIPFDDGGTIKPGAVSTSVYQDLDSNEIGIRFKSRQIGYGTIPIYASAEAFYSRMTQDTFMQADTGGTISLLDAARVLRRRAKVEGNLGGFQVGAETAIPLPSTAFSFVGRASGGAYIIGSSAQFSDNFGAGDVKDDDLGVGLRAGAEGGFRYDLGNAALLSVTARIDHFTDIPTAVLPRVAGAGPSHVDTDDLTAYSINGRLTLSLGQNLETLKN